MDKFMKDLLGHSQMHDEIEKAKATITKMKAEYRHEVYLQKARPVVQGIVNKGVKLQSALTRKNIKLREEQEKLKATKITSKRFTFEKLYEEDGKGNRFINTDYLTKMPILRDYITQQLQTANGLTEIKAIINEIMEYDNHETIVYDALKNALETFKPDWYTASKHAADEVQDPMSFDYDYWLSDVLQKLEYATGTEEEKACFDRLVAIEKELQENEAEHDRLYEATQFKAEINIDDGEILEGAKKMPFTDSEGYWAGFDKMLEGE